MLAEHVERGVAAGPGGVFVACGTGEFHALEPSSSNAAVAVAVEVDRAAACPSSRARAGRCRLADRFARAAERAGADGLLLLPPYLVTNPPKGLVRYVAEVAAATGLPLIVYQRDNADLHAGDRRSQSRPCPSVVGFKDGLGDLDLMQRIVLAVRSAVGEDVPVLQRPADRRDDRARLPGHRRRAVLLGGVLLRPGDLPRLPPGRAHRRHRDRSNRLLAEFYQPLVELRDKVPGYAVSLVKAAVRLRGLDVGGVRPPLSTRRRSTWRSWRRSSPGRDRCLTTRMKITDIVITPVAFRDPPLLNSVGRARAVGAAHHRASCTPTRGSRASARRYGDTGHLERLARAARPSDRAWTCTR